MAVYANEGGTLKPLAIDSSSAVSPADIKFLILEYNPSSYKTSSTYTLVSIQKDSSYRTCLGLFGRFQDTNYNLYGGYILSTDVDEINWAGSDTSGKYGKHIIKLQEERQGNSEDIFFTITIKKDSSSQNTDMQATTVKIPVVLFFFK